MFSLKHIYLVIFISLAAWIGFAYFTTTEIINNQKQFAHIINLSGKQRMLSQKTTLIAKRYFETGDGQLKQHLSELYHDMQQEHREITDNYVNFDAIENIYYQPPQNLNKKIDEYLSLLERFIRSPDQNRLKKLESLSFALLPLINKAVYIFEKDSNEKTEALMRRELFILIGTFLTLFFEAVVIVMPTIRASSRSNKELRELVRQRTRALEQLSVTDQLTGLYNRRKIDEILATEIAQAGRYKHAFALILIDIDFFKKVNDRYGHQTGDRVLKTIADILASRVRKSDLLGRWGGEEFLIISMEQDPQKTLVFAEKLRCLVDEYDFGTPAHLSCSFGIACFEPGDTANSLLLRADHALYAAKSGGRNCVRVADQTGRGR